MTKPRAPDLAERGIEVFLGAVLGLFGLGMLSLLPFGFGEIVAHLSEWNVWVGVVVLGFVCVWCLQTAWRLLTGHEGPGGGLFSPVVLFVMAAAFAAGSAAFIVFRGIKGSGWAVFMTIALACFNLARWRTAKSRKAKNEYAA